MTMLNLALLFHYGINISKLTPYGSDAFPKLVSVKNSVAVESGLFLSQPFKHSHFHFLITVKLATIQVLSQRCKQMICLEVQSFSVTAHV